MKDTGRVSDDDGVVEGMEGVQDSIAPDRPAFRHQGVE